MNGDFLTSSHLTCLGCNHCLIKILSAVSLQTDDCSQSLAPAALFAWENSRNV